MGNVSPFIDNRLKEMEEQRIANFWEKNLNFI